MAIPARIFDGERWWGRSMLIVDGDRIEGIAAAGSLVSVERVSLPAGVIAPGLIDLQVNGGGGALLHLNPDVRGASERTDSAAYQEPRGVAVDIGWPNQAHPTSK